MPCSLSSDSKNYRLESLDDTKQQIRLVSILPAPIQDNRFRCAIQTFDLEKAPPFTALSYIWGPPSPCHQILVGGGALEVRENLLHFLHEFRKQAEKEKSDEYLWIDQICINQKDIPERSHQVKMMGDIYKGADSVVVWLGDGKHHRSGPTEYECIRTFKDTGDPAPLLYVSENGYFSRLWIVQEFLLAKRLRILVKDLWLLEQDFFSLDNLALNRHQWPPSFFSLRHERQRQTELHATRRRGMADMLHTFRFQSCEDPRDKIYGLMGLVDEDERVVVDYAKSVQQVFMDAVLVTCADSQKNYKRIMLFSDILEHMPFTATQTVGVIALLLIIWRPEALGRFDGLPCPITAMGFQPGGEIDGVDRWCFEFLETRYYVECVGNFELINDSTKQLRDTDWKSYLPG